MDVASAIDEVKNVLGDPIIDLEVTDTMIQQNLVRAFKVAKPHFSFTDFMSVPYAPDQNYVDLSSYTPAVIEVIHVYESPISKYSIVDPDVFYMRNFYNMMSMARLFMARSEIENLVSRDFMYVNGRLYLNEIWSTNLTIEVILDYDDPSEIQDTFFIDWITRYTIALTKETLGRIRGKYTVRNAPYELDASKLLAEAKSEKDGLMKELTDNGGFFFVTR